MRTSPRAPGQAACWRTSSRNGWPEEQRQESLVDHASVPTFVNQGMKMPGHFGRHARRRTGAHGEAGPSSGAPGSDSQSGDKRSSLGDKSSLGGRASRALGWSFSSNVLARLGTVGIGITLARLLGPHAFGTYAVAYVALIAVLSFNELGVSLAIVRWQGEPGEIAPTVTTISLITSIAIYVGCFLGAPTYAAAMGAPSATSVVRVLALNVVIDGAVSTPAALLQRHFRQDKKAITDQVNCWLGAGITIALAWVGFGAMSLAIGRLAGCLAGGILLVAFSPEPVRLGYDRAKARALLRFGLPLGGASLIVFAVLNVDQLIVGHLLGATALGCYVLAFNLSGWPGNIFSQPVRTVAPAVFSRLQHDRKARSGYFLNVASLLGAVALPVCVLLSGSAVPLIGFVYGGRWLPAAQALIWLGLLAALRIFFELVYDYFVVLAKSRVVLLVQLVWLVALIPALIVGTRVGGIYGAGASRSRGRRRCGTSLVPHRTEQRWHQAARSRLSPVASLHGRSCGRTRGHGSEKDGSNRLDCARLQWHRDHSHHGPARVPHAGYPYLAAICTRQGDRHYSSRRCCLRTSPQDSGKPGRGAYPADQPGETVLQSGRNRPYTRFQREHKRPGSTSRRPYSGAHLLADRRIIAVGSGRGPPSQTRHGPEYGRHQRLAAGQRQ